MSAKLQLLKLLMFRHIIHNSFFFMLYIYSSCLTGRLRNSKNVILFQLLEASIASIFFNMLHLHPRVSV